MTGAGGSIGRELCRQVSATGARRLVMVDHSENNLFEIDLELRERGHAGLLVPVIADCKDAAAMERVFASERPEIVFHAAAYKHVPMMELNPVQAIANNALATAVLADLAERFDGRALLPHLHRQGRRAEDRHGRLEGARRAGGRGARRRLGHPLRGRALRQRPRQLRLGAADLPAPDRRGRAR